MLTGTQETVTTHAAVNINETRIASARSCVKRAIGEIIGLRRRFGGTMNSDDSTARRIKNAVLTAIAPDLQRLYTELIEERTEEIGRVVTTGSEGEQELLKAELLAELERRAMEYAWSLYLEEEWMSKANLHFVQGSTAKH